MGLRVILIGALFLVIAVLFVAPLMTISVHVQLPPGSRTDPAAAELNKGIALAVLAAVAVALLGLVGFLVWIIRRLLKRIEKRKKPKPADVF